VDDPPPDLGTPVIRAAEPTPVTPTGPRPEELLRCRRLRTLEELIDDVLAVED
jgi:hypothetical protein